MSTIDYETPVLLRAKEQELSAETYGLPNHVYLARKNREGKFAAQRAEGVVSTTICYGDMIRFIVTSSGSNSGQVISAKNMMDYAAWQDPEPFPREEIEEALDELGEVVEECSADGVGPVIKCVVTNLGPIIDILQAALSLKQYLYQFYAVLKKDKWAGPTSGGPVGSGDEVQLMKLYFQATTPSVDEAIVKYWAILVGLSMVRAKGGPAGTLAMQTSALAVLAENDPESYRLLTEDPELFAVKNDDLDGKNVKLKIKTKGTSGFRKRFIIVSG